MYACSCAGTRSLSQIGCEHCSDHLDRNFEIHILVRGGPGGPGTPKAQETSRRQRARLQTIESQTSRLQPARGISGSPEQKPASSKPRKSSKPSKPSEPLHESKRVRRMRAWGMRYLLLHASCARSPESEFDPSDGWMHLDAFTSGVRQKILHVFRDGLRC